MTMVIDIHKQNGIRPPFDIYIGRRVRFTEFTHDSKWANHFYSDLAAYEKHIREHLWNDLAELDGKTLGCWCIFTDQEEPLCCHGQILMKLLREKKQNQPTSIHICTCLDMCEWQPCPYAGKELPDGCPYKKKEG